MLLLVCFFKRKPQTKNCLGMREHCRKWIKLLNVDVLILPPKPTISCLLWVKGCFSRNMRKKTHKNLFSTSILSQCSHPKMLSVALGQFLSSSNWASQTEKQQKINLRKKLFILRESYLCFVILQWEIWYFGPSFSTFNRFWDEGTEGDHHNAGKNMELFYSFNRAQNGEQR